MVYTLADGTQMTRRKRIPVTGAASGAQTDFQIKMAALAYAAAMQNDFDDLRFTQADMQTLIDAWLEDKSDGSSADVWGEFPTTPANGVTQDYWMYYGNAGAASNWDGSATFPFFDDFTPDGDVMTVVTFGLLESCQYTTESGDLYAGCRDGLNRMAAFVTQMNSLDVDFCIHVGDYCNGYLDKTTSLDHIDLLEDEYDNLTMSRYYVLGNHDEQYTSKAEFFSHTGASEKYFSFDVSDFHFIVLDANFRSDSDTDDYDSGNFDWTIPYVPPNQRTWLTNDLAGTSKKCIVFIHQILDPGGAANFKVINAAAVRTILENSGKVIMVFQGHHCEDYLNYVNGIPYMQIYEMASVNGTGYAVVSIDNNNRIFINGYGLHSDYNTFGNKWSTAETPTIAGGIATINSANEGILGNNGYGTGYSWRSRYNCNITQGTGKSLEGWNNTILSGDTPYEMFNAFTTSPYRRTLQSGDPIAENLDATYLGSYHIYEIMRGGAASTLFYIDDILKRTSSASNTGTLYPNYMMYGDGGQIDIDWVFVRKYVTNPPTAAIGTEEHQRRTPQFI